MNSEKKSNKPRVNVPEKHKPRKPFTASELDQDLSDRIDVIQEEFRNGLAFVREHAKTVTFFGSSRLTEENVYYQKARTLGEKISQEGYHIITGGGPGIMEAANRGAYEADCKHCSLGMNIELPGEQILNPYVEDYVSFYYFFARKVALTFSAETYLFFPGGFGTLDEFFEILTLIQTHKIPQVPVVCVGSKYWNQVDDLINNLLLDHLNAIDADDSELYTITDDEEEVLEIVKNAKLRDE